MRPRAQINVCGVECTHVVGEYASVENVDVDTFSGRVIVGVGEREVAGVLISEIARLADALQTPRRIGSTEDNTCQTSAALL